ncbi:MAG TPA: hypothetical protein VHD59_10910 [Pseudolabrys sp.]|nr:hypothetical protein [Pseudolabrys sp.]
MGRLGLLVAAALIAGGFSLQQAYAQSDNAAQKTEKADKKKSTEKKTTTQQTNTQTNSSGSAPMSGFRPDPVSNY